MCQIPPDFKWSFSKLSAYEQCPQSFKLQYLEKCSQIENAYAQFGTYCHGLLEQWARGELAVFELADAYAAGYDRSILASFPPFPRALGQKYYEAGLSYFNTFEGFGEEFDVLAVEDRFELDIAGHPFVGIADLVLRDKACGGITVIDHKSTSMTSMKKKLASKKRQLYLYAEYVRQQFGEDPAMLRFNLFRDAAWIDEPFQPEKKAETLRWVQDTIASIQADAQWKVSTSDYFCRYICGVSPHCGLGR